MTNAAMKRAMLLGSTVLLALGIQGCPIYPDEPVGCFTNSDCEQGTSCDTYTGRCYTDTKPSVPITPTNVSCTRPLDCGINETCTSSGTCQVGDCAVGGRGCVKGYFCSAADGAWRCVQSGAGGSGGAGGTGGKGGKAGSSGKAGAAGSSGGGQSGSGGAVPVGVGGASVTGGVTHLGGAAPIGGDAAVGGALASGGHSHAGAGGSVGVGGFAAGGNTAGGSSGVPAGGVGPTGGVGL